MLESGGHTHSETVNPTSYTHQHMHSQVKHFQEIRKVQLLKFNPVSWCFMPSQLVRLYQGDTHLIYFNNMYFLK